MENETQKLLWDFNIQTYYPISAKRLDLVIFNKKNRTYRIVDFGVSADHRAKWTESVKKDKYLDLARELKKPWNMKVTVIPIVIGALGTVPKWLVEGKENLEIKRRVETILTTALLRSVRILRRVLETWRRWLSHSLQWETIS